MNQLKHNKKRNVGLLNEFFARQIAFCVLEKKYDAMNNVKALWSKYLTESVELSKERQIFDAIYTSRVEDINIARSLLENLKKIVINQDYKKLNDEKTRLLHEINNSIGDSSFFEREVKDYRTQATIQTMINCWREASQGNIEAIQASAHLEDQVLKHLISQPLMEQKDASILEYGDEEINGLVVNIMLEKFNKHYGESLSEEQKKILNMYIFSSKDQGKRQDLLNLLESIRQESTALLQKECKTNHNKLLVEKFSKIHNLLSEASSPYRIVSEGSLNDDLVTFYMSVSKIKEELDEKDETTR